MKKNNFVKTIVMFFVVLFLVCIVAVIIQAIYVFFEYHKNNDDFPVQVPVASQDIISGEYITNPKVKFIEISKNKLPDGNISNISDIVGKCVKTDYEIEENSYFYDYMLVECEDDTLEGDYFDVSLGNAVTMINFDYNQECFEGCGKTVKNGDNKINVYADHNTLKIDNKEVLNYQQSMLSIRQVTLYKDIVIISTPSIMIYDLKGNLLKEINQFNDDKGRLFVSYLWYNSSEGYAFDITEEGKIQFIGTKHTQGAQNTYMDDNNNSIDLCSNGSHISDDSIVSGVFEFSYLGNGKFSDITYVSTRSTVKDIRHCS